MRHAYIVIFIFLFWSCGSHKSPADPAKKRRDDFLAKFKNKAFDTLYVYSPGSDTGEYGGLKLDSADAVLFPTEIAQAHFNDPPGLFAVYKFPLDKQFIGLIARTPSMYYPTSIKLFLYDSVKGQITTYTELAETWGDAGDVLEKSSWIFRNRGKTQAFVSTTEIHDHSVEDEKDTTVERMEFYYVIDLSRHRIDTMNADQQALRSQFGRLLKLSRASK